MKIYQFILLISVVAVLSSCQLFGLSYAYSYKQEHGENFGRLDCDAFEWITSRKDNDMTLQYQAIMRANMEAYYHDSVFTFFVMKNETWDAWLQAYKYSSMEQVPVARIREYLMRSIIPGKYLSTDISVPVFVQTLDTTMTMRLYKTIVAPTSSQNLNSLRAGWTNPNGKINQVGVTTSNLEPRNGALHVQSARFTTLD